MFYLIKKKKNQTIKEFSSYTSWYLYLQYMRVRIGVHLCKNYAVIFKILSRYSWAKGLQVALVVKNLPSSAEDARDVGSIPESGRCLGEGNGNPLQYFLPGKSHGQRSLVGSSVVDGVAKESDLTQQLSNNSHNQSSLFLVTKLKPWMAKHPRIHHN